MSVGNAHLTRPVLGLDNLDLSDDTYDVMFDESNLLDIGGVQWRRTTAESPFVPGRIVTAIVKDVETKTVRVDVSGSSLTDVQTNVGTLLAAVWQSYYHLSVSFDSDVAAYRWHCEPADVNVGFTFQHLLGFIAPVTLVIPCSPIPLAGPI